MAQGSKKKYTSKQKRKAEHIEEGYEKRGVSKKDRRGARLGDGEQIGQGRKEERLGPREEEQQSELAKGRKKRRQEIRRPEEELSKMQVAALPPRFHCRPQKRRPSRKRAGQIDFALPHRRHQRSRFSERTNSCVFARPMAERARKKAGIPVIYVNDNFGRWQSDFRRQVQHCLRGESRGHEIVKLLQPEEDDYFVLKPKHSGFFSTTLETLLRYLRIGDAYHHRHRRKFLRALYRERRLHARLRSDHPLGLHRVEYRRGKQGGFELDAKIPEGGHAAFLQDQVGSGRGKEAASVQLFSSLPASVTTLHHASHSEQLRRSTAGVWGLLALARETFAWHKTKPRAPKPALTAPNFFQHADRFVFTARSSARDPGLLGPAQKEGIRGSRRRRCWLSRATGGIGSMPIAITQLRRNFARIGKNRRRFSESHHAIFRHAGECFGLHFPGERTAEGKEIRRGEHDASVLHRQEPEA